MRTKIFLIAILCLMFCLTGCDGKTKISGTVKFSDGTPITKGSVVFDNGTESYFGTIKNDGTYIPAETNRSKEFPTEITRSGWHKQKSSKMFWAQMVVLSPTL